MRVSAYRSSRMIEIKDNYWDKEYKAFIQSNGTFGPSGDAEMVASIFEMNLELLEKAKIGHCYYVKTDGPFGEIVDFVEVPKHWYDC